MSSIDYFQHARTQMVQHQLQARGITDRRLLQVMREVPRHEFVPRHLRHLAYHEAALPIGDQQSLTPPGLIATMIQSLALRGGEHVLEVGTGSGYQAAVLSSLVRDLFSLERAPRLALRAGETLSRLNFHNIDIHHGDGSQGLADMAPFDAIVVNAAVPKLPGPLCVQLHPQGGRMVIPVGTRERQRIQLVSRQGDHWYTRYLDTVSFKPLVGRYGFPPAPASAAGLAGV